MTCRSVFAPSYFSPSGSGRVVAAVLGVHFGECIGSPWSAAGRSTGVRAVETIVLVQNLLISGVSCRSVSSWQAVRGVALLCRSHKRSAISIGHISASHSQARLSRTGHAHTRTEFECMCMIACSCRLVLSLNVQLHTEHNAQVCPMRTCVYI